MNCHKNARLTPKGDGAAFVEDGFANSADTCISIQMTLRYAHLATGDLAQCAAALDRHNQCEVQARREGPAEYAGRTRLDEPAFVTVAPACGKCL